MAVITLLLGHLRLVGYALAVMALLAFVGWIGHLVEQHRRDEARIAVVEQQLAGAVETNQQTIAALARFKAETEKAQAAVAADAERRQDRDAAVASIHQEIAHAKPPAGAPAAAGPGPYTAAALGRLRQLRAQGDHSAASREGGHPAGAAGMPSRP